MPLAREIGWRHLFIIEVLEVSARGSVERVGKVLTGDKMKEELIELAGVVVDKQPNAFFKVQIHDSEHIVLATISGRMRRNRIRILMGDRVDVELSPYDLSKGRITYRHK